MFARSILALAALGAASTTMAQLSLPSSILGLSFSAPCQQAVLSVLTSGNFSECTGATDLFSIYTNANGSIIPVLDGFMSDICYSAPCSNATLMAAEATILAGCQADLTNDTLSDSVVVDAFNSYSLVREVLCLKTIDPYTNTSYGGSLGNPPIPVTSPVYNSTNGTFCVTSVLTQLSAYFDADISLSYIESLVGGTNTTGLGLAKNISSTVLCNECIFAAVDLIEEEYPIVGDVPLSAIYGFLKLNMTSPTNTTVNGLLNGTCAYESLSVNTNGTLPSNITVSIVNSTFPFNVTNGNATTSSSMKRWFGRV